MVWLLVCSCTNVGILGPSRVDIAIETSEVQPYRFSHGLRTYALVDTPGFDDSRMSNNEITDKILQWLKTSYRTGTRLNGILYIHDIRKPRVQGSAYKNMRLLNRLCGGDDLQNVTLATSFWDQVATSVGIQREHELKTSTEFWASLMAKGAEVVRLDGGRTGCLEVLERIAAWKESMLDIGGQQVASSSSEIREFEETMDRESKAEKERLQRKLEQGQNIHEQNMEQLRIHRAQSQRQAEQRERLAEKEHKRQMREDRQQMKQERQDVEHSLLRMEGKHPWYRKIQLLTAFWLLLATSLVGNTISESLGDTSASINFAMFAIVWSWVGVLIGIASYDDEEFPLTVLLFWDILATLFVFSSAADLAGRLGINNCANEARRKAPFHIRSMN